MTAIPKLVVAMLAAGAMLSTNAQAQPSRPECIAPAKPGGGFDLTCKLAQTALQDGGQLKSPMRVTYMPGGIGAVAYNAVVAQRPADGQAIVAFSSGSLLNLAHGKFGKYGPDDVKWLAAIGTDYGMVAVAANSPYKTLKDLMAAMKADPQKVVFGAGGSVGSQDWMKAALVAKQAGVEHRTMRYVAFEGGGEAITALLGNHVQVVPGDIGEVAGMLEAGKIRVLAVLADKRLPGKLAAIPTAKEQGFDVQWPIVRGFYMGPKVPDAEFQWWSTAFRNLLASRQFGEALDARGLFPFAKTGPELDSYVKAEVARYQTLAREFGLMK
ncbi:tripartite tricarboxylate transporter substrate binding protein [Cupriavidus cauae]|uniref:Bug family tripartite tricarboxylate transporter substrate binding protein n=1 Tax=Cupriavidus cauae TaxID=2608999 RepID=UPI002243E726|nr:tripartite tricarboxylate transporter substrate binding protein [Cupriavidus cauae]UZN51437.1 tripartite tricarboxylate transporter substrate binding protein [Cupriavidus cauae]